VEKQFEAIKNDYARDHGAVPWSDSLASYRLTETDVKNHIALELSQLRLVDARLRPAIQIEAGDIEAYYKDRFGSQASGSQKISLQAATPKIRELLTQEKMNELLSAWRRACIPRPRSKCLYRLDRRPSNEQAGVAAAQDQALLFCASLLFLPCFLAFLVFDHRIISAVGARAPDCSG
jgi:hypothetical protein